MSFTNCIITGIPITENISGQTTMIDNHTVYWYAMEINGNRTAIYICSKLARNYLNKEGLKLIEENRTLRGFK
jgi:hypothetical protein